MAQMSARWQTILREAAQIVNGYDTQVTLRQLFYRLVAAQYLDNTKSEYTQLSSKTAQARRDGTFPELLDNVREIHEDQTWTSPRDAVANVIATYRRDRTEHQEFAVYVATEKATMVEQLRSWFGEDGLPVVALGGYSSQTYVHRILKRLEHDERQPVLLYAGDFDPSGIDILDDFDHRTERRFEVVRVALTEDQVEEYRLPVAPGKTKDSRSDGFKKRYGRLIQVELEALDPDDLHDLYDQALDRFWDEDAYDRSLRQENDDIKQLKELKGRR